MEILKLVSQSEKPLSQIDIQKELNIEESEMNTKVHELN